MNALLIDFPPNPIVGQTYTTPSGVVYEFNGVAWVATDEVAIQVNPWKRLYEDIKIQIPGVIDAVQAQVTFSLFKDFCDKTNLWQEDVAVPVAPEVTSYPFTLMGKGAVNRLLMMYDPKYEHANRHWVQGHIQMTTPNILTINYAPSEATTWRAIIAKTPKDPATAERYPDIDTYAYWIVDKYREALTYGILGRLQKMPGKPYSNAKEARDNTLYYNSERSKARVDGLHANVFGGQRWIYPQGFASVRRGGWV